MRINTTTDMIKAIALAMRNADMDLIEACERTNQEWLQPDDEREAMENLIAAAMDAIENEYECTAF